MSIQSVQDIYTPSARLPFILSSEIVDLFRLGSHRMTKDFLDPRPELMTQWSGQNPLGRIGRPDELRGVTVWLASDASTFCTGSE